jgi:hypothetical protein
MFGSLLALPTKARIFHYRVNPSQTRGHPQDDLAKFGYTPGMKVRPKK